MCTIVSTSQRNMQTANLHELIATTNTTTTTTLTIQDGITTSESAASHLLPLPNIIGMGIRSVSTTIYCLVPNKICFLLNEGNARCA